LRALRVRRWTQPPPAGAPWVHASGAALQPCSAQAAPARGAGRLAAAPRRRGPGGRHTCAGRTCCGRPAARATRPACGASRPSSPPRSHAPPPRPRPAMLQWPRAIPHERCGGHHAHPGAGEGRRPHARPDGGAPVCGRPARLGSARRPVEAPPACAVRPPRPPRGPTWGCPEAARAAGWHTLPRLAGRARSTPACDGPHTAPPG
jgi:hypothetical protein